MASFCNTFAKLFDFSIGLAWATVALSLIQWLESSPVETVSSKVQKYHLKEVKK